MISNLRIIASLFLIAVLFNCKTSNAQLTATPPSHIIVLIEENYAYSQIIGPSAAVYAPYLNALTSDTFCAVFSQSYAIEHPSEPNYLDLYSGENQGTTGSDGYPAGTVPMSTPNLGAELIAKGKTFVTYSEGLPSPGYDGQNVGLYYRKHNPAQNWVNTGTPGTNQYGPNVSVPMAGYWPDSANYSNLPTVSYLVPNSVNDMHDGSYPTNIEAGDTWFHNNVSSLLRWALCNNTLVIITFDEDDDAHGNNIPTLFYGPMVKAASSGTYTQPFTHYNVLRTIEQWYGTSYAGAAADSTAITYCWRTSAVNVCVKEGVEQNAVADFSIQVVPNPANNEVTFTSNLALTTGARVTVTDILGRIVASCIMRGTSLKINTAGYQPGLYFYKISGENGNLAASSKFIISHY